MANRTLNMVKLKRAFQMLSVSTPQREICAQLHIGRGVLNRYKKLADEAKVDYSTVGRMSEEPCMIPKLSLYSTWGKLSSFIVKLLLLTVALSIRSNE